MPGRGRPEGRLGEILGKWGAWGWGGRLTALMARVVRAAGLVLGGCAVAAALVVLDARPAAPCSGAPLRLRVAASAAIAPAAGRIAARFSAGRPSVSGRCVTVTVAARPAASVAAALSRPGSGDRPAIDAWIPDSTTWADDVRRARGAAFLPDGPEVARTPLVFAVRDGRATEARRERLGWHSLVPSAIDTRGRAAGTPFTARVPDPDGDSTGVAALAALRAATGGGTPGVTRLATAFAALGTVPAAGGDPGRRGSAIPGLSGSGAHLVVTSEQAFWARGRHDGGATVVYPSDGSPALTYRYLVGTRDEARRRAAWTFGSALLTRAARRDFAAAGFRPPDGSRAAFTARDGLDPGPFIALSAPDDRSALRLRRMWRRHERGIRLLIALDVSTSMGTPLPGRGGSAGPASRDAAPASRAVLPASPGGVGAAPPAGDRLRVAVAGIRRWLGALGDGDAAGLWTFAAGPGEPPSTPYRRDAPIRPLNADHRRALDAALGSATPRQMGGGLDATVLAAYERAARDARPGHRTAVVVVTDGRGTGPAGRAAARTLRRLAAAYDPRHPVDLSIVAFGPDADASTVRAMAAAVHGTSWTTRDPREAPDLLAAIPPHLTCAATCP